MDAIIWISLAILFLWIFFEVLLLPVTIAKNRGVSGSELTTIRILCWCALIIGLTWIVALVLSLIYEPQRWTDKSKGDTNMDLDKLDKLFDLKKKGAITEEEFKREKKKLMGK